jgi:membrane protein
MVTQTWLHGMTERFSWKRMPDTVKKTKAFLAILGHDIKQTNLMLHASSMAYMTLGSIVPLLALTFALISAFQPIADPNATWFATFKIFILENLAPRSGQSMVEFMETFLANLDVARIGLTGFLTLIVLIVILLRDIEMALNSIWQVPHTRPIFKRFVFFWITTTLGAVLLSVVFAAFSQLNILEGLGYRSGTEPTPLESALSYLVNLMSTFVFFSVLHKITPNCHVSWKAAMVGGLVATVLIRLASAGFGLYSTSSQWNQNVYEALAVVPLFLLWLYLGWFVILFSAIIAWRTHHGFKVKRAHEAIQSKEIENEALNYRDLQLRSVLPYICIMELGARFLSTKGQGSLGKELAVELDVPPYWIREALLIAEDLGLILIKRPAEKKGDMDNDVLELMAYPSFPLGRMSLAEVLQRLSADAQLWLHKRPSALPLGVGKLMESTFECLQRGQLTLTIEQLVERAEGQPSRAGT